MNTLNKKDLRLSVIVGIAAGFLVLPILHNFQVALNIKTIFIAVGGLSFFTPFGYWVAAYLSRWFPVLLQFVKFGIVGGLNAMLDFGVLNLLMWITDIAQGPFYTVFKVISASTAMTNSYFWNKYWTFQSQQGSGGGEVGRFLGVNLIGLLINAGAATFVVNIIGAPAGFDPKIWANIGGVSAVLISLFWNFLGMKFFVFKSRE